jgi:hypothetical protein
LLSNNGNTKNSILNSSSQTLLKISSIDLSCNIDFQQSHVKPVSSADTLAPIITRANGPAAATAAKPAVVPAAAADKPAHVVAKKERNFLIKIYFKI